MTPNDFSGPDARILERHVSSIKSNVYAIHNLPPEVVAVLFAYVSRSPESFRANLLKLIKEKDIDVGNLIEGFSAKGMDYGAAAEKARKFHERWVVGYGHSSVAEHAVAHLALEDVSILASKVIEDNRLASYTEKSTRYQVFDRGRYHKPASLMQSPLGRVYAETCDALFDFYTASFPVMLSFMKKKHPKPSDMPDALYENVTKARACDVLRYALPASTYTSIGMTANARVLERAISKMLSHPLAEMNDIGTKAKEEVRKVIPTLVKYADRNAYMTGLDAAMEKLPVMRGGRKKKGGRLVTLVAYDHDAEDRVLSSVLYRYSDMPHKETLELAKSFGMAKKTALLESLFSGRGRFDAVPRELENASYTFDILVDYGAFRDVQRHRICTQVNQDVTTAHGYDVPQELKEAGLDRKFAGLMEKADAAFRKIGRKFPKEAQYVVPLAYRKRVLMTLNLRELHHFISLRSGREGHMSYRKVAWEMYDEIAKVHPVLAKYIRVDRSDGPSR